MNKKEGGIDKEEMGPIFEQKLEVVKLVQDELLEEAEKLKKRAIGFNISVNFGRIRSAKETTLLKMEKHIKEKGTKEEKDKLKNLNLKIDTQKNILSKANSEEAGKISNALEELKALSKKKNNFLMKF